MQMTKINLAKADIVLTTGLNGGNPCTTSSSSALLYLGKDEGLDGKGLLSYFLPK
jgi:hypothetical protein